MLSLFKGIFGNSNAELQEVLNQNPILIDVRTAAEFAGGSVRGAKNIPLNEIEQHVKKLDMSKPIVVFCQSGNRSGQAMQLLKRKGFNLVHNGGGWRSLKSLVEG